MQQSQIVHQDRDSHITGKHPSSEDGVR